MNYPDLSPEIFSIGPFALRWYGLAYLAGFVAAYWLGLRYGRRFLGWDKDAVADVIFYGALGVIIGGRLGYVFFYGWDEFVANPLWLFMVWKGGMASHGGLIGVIVAMVFFARARGMRLFEVTDFIAPLTPPGLGFGRLGNFVNTELPGRITEVPWGFHYPCSAVAQIDSACAGKYEAVLRHPSSLYQAGLEGIVLGLFLWWYVRKPRRLGSVSGMFLLGYGCLRIFSESFRMPDAQIGYVAFDAITRGQVLCVPMIVLGAGLLVWARAKEQPPRLAPLANEAKAAIKQAAA